MQGNLWYFKNTFVCKNKPRKHRNLTQKYIFGDLSEKNAKNNYIECSSNLCKHYIKFWEKNYENNMQA